LSIAPVNKKTAPLAGAVFVSDIRLASIVVIDAPIGDVADSIAISHHPDYAVVAMMVTVVAVIVIVVVRTCAHLDAYAHLVDADVATRSKQGGCALCG
jgi:hypothetical protein